MSHWHGQEEVRKGTDRLLACVLRDNHVAMEPMPGGLQWQNVDDINEGWDRDTSVLRKDHAIYNVIGSAKTGAELGEVRGRIPTFLREAHSFLREAHIANDAREEGN